MKIIDPSFEIINCPDGKEALLLIEKAARTCYRSENKTSEGTAEDLIRRCIKSGHKSVIEHGFITVKFICDRGVSHELVRHRICSFSQESSRYCDYSKDKFGNEITFIRPLFWEDQQAYLIWRELVRYSEEAYMNLLRMGLKPENARSILPNSLKTEIVITANLREWRHILKLRTSKKAHPQMRQLMIPLLEELKKRIPVIFDDILLGSTEA